MPAPIGRFFLFDSTFTSLRFTVRVVPSSRPSFKTQFRDYTHRFPMQLSEHNLASGNTTNSGYIPTVVSFLPQPMPHLTRRVGSTRPQHQSPPSVQVVALVLAQSSLWPSRLMTTSRRICSQIIRYSRTILSQIPHSEIQTPSTAWVKPRIGCCCSALYPSFSQLSRTFPNIPSCCLQKLKDSLKGA